MGAGRGGQGMGAGAPNGDSRAPNGDSRPFNGDRTQVFIHGICLDSISKFEGHS